MSKVLALTTDVEAGNVFRGVLKKDKQALAVIAKSPIQALVALSSEDLDLSSRGKADVLDVIVDSVASEDNADPRTMLKENLTPEVHAEFLCGLGDLPAIAVSYTALEVVLIAVRNEIKKGKLSRLQYWVKKLGGAGYESFTEFLESPATSVLPQISAGKFEWNIADLLLASFITNEQEVPDWIILRSMVVDYGIEGVLHVDDVEDRTTKILSKIDEFEKCINPPEAPIIEEYDDEEDGEGEYNAADDVSDDEDDADQPSGDTADAADELDLDI